MSAVVIFDAKLKEERNHWLKRLAGGITSTATLNPDYNRVGARPPANDASLSPAKAGDRRLQGRFDYCFDAALTSHINRLAGSSPFLLYTLLVSGVKVCLRRYTGSTEVAIGSPPLAEYRQANALAILDEVRDEESFRELLMRVRQSLLDAYAHQRYPYRRLLKELGVAGNEEGQDENTKRAWLFDVAVELSGFHGRLAEAGESLRLRFEEKSAEPGARDDGAGASGALSVGVEYDDQRYSRRLISRFVGHCEEILRSAVADVSRSVGELEMLSAEESRLQLVEWNRTEAEYPHAACIHQIFESQVERIPEWIALIDGREQMSYRELDRRANQLGRYLQRLGVGPEVVVGLCLERSAEMAVALMGVLKAGGAYLPLDPEYPPKRLGYMLEDARVRVAVTRREFEPRLPAFVGQTVCLDEEWESISKESDDKPESAGGVENSAYVIYTSGSTGQPKGVVVEHHGVVNLANWQARAFHLSPQSRISQFFSYSFDGAVGETFMALLNGGTLVISERDDLEPRRLTEFLNRQGINVAVFVPSVIKQLDPELIVCPEALTVVSVGESCPAEMAAEWSRRSRFINGYGPTEYTVYSHVWEANEEKVRELGGVSIGCPIDNTRCYILDERMRPAPVGVAGEIYLGGEGIARGYLNQPEVTADRFIPNEFIRSEEVKDHGLISVASALEEIKMFRERNKARRGRKKGKRKEEREEIANGRALESVKGLDEDLIQRTKQFIEKYSGDEIAYQGFSRYFEEGANESYASCGINEEMLRIVLPYQNYAGLKGMDFCFGNGEVLEALSGMGAEVEGLDLSPFLVQRARRKKLNVRMGKVDIMPEKFREENGIGEETQDFVISTLTLDRLENPKGFLMNVFRSLKEGGRFAIQTILPIVPIDDGKVERPITYTSIENRITRGESVEEDKETMVRALNMHGGSEINICRMPYVVASRDGVQEYEIWSFYGVKERKREGRVYHQKLYKTGDVGSYLADGSIRYLGRKDQQVKIRGYRIELEEVERALNSHRSVRESVVVARDDERGGKALIGYVVGEEASASELKKHVRERLPEYMTPGAIVVLGEMPLTANGKIDRERLPAPSSLRDVSEQGEYGEARTVVEEMLVGVFEDLLRVEGVGIRDSFFEMGGHSLLATQVVSRVRAMFGVDLGVRSIFAEPTVEGLGRLVEEAMRVGEKDGAPPLVRVPREGERGAVVRMPLSFAQRRLWFLDQLAPNNPFYNCPGAVRFEGRLDLEALESVINEIVRRHEVLRTRFEVEEDEPVQVIDEWEHRELEVVDLTGLTREERDAEVGRMAREDAETGFDLRRGPLLRAKVLKLGEEEHVLLFTMHHSVSDAWSMGILIREAGTLYRAYSARARSPLEELPIQYADYAVWQRKYLAGGVLEAEVEYWKGRLKDAAALDLPTDYARPAMLSYWGGAERIEIRKEFSEGLRRLIQREGATLFMALMAAFKVVLMRYSGVEDVSVGTVVANRTRREVEGLIGFFVNTLVMRTDLSGNPSFRELVERERETALGAYARQEAPFERLVEEINPERDLSRSPLFQVMLLLQNAGREELEIGDLKLRQIGSEASVAEFDLTLALAEEREGIAGCLVYSQDLYEAETIRMMARHYEKVVEELVRDAGQRIGEVELLSDVERRQIIEEWNATAIAYQEVKLAHEMIAGQADLRPEAVAVVYGEEHVSYGELNERTNQLARFLRKSGVGGERRVGICVEKGIAIVESVLGVMKAGGAYVPMDPEHPVERRNYMAENSGCEVVISDARLKSEFERAGRRVIDLEADGEKIRRESGQRYESEVDLDNLAYVIYTSGSTGAPKGVMISHRSISNRILWEKMTMPLDESDALLQLASFSFDVSVWEIFTPLVSGARLVLPGPDERKNPSRIASLIQDHEITVVGFVPSMLDLLLDEPVETRFASLKRVLCGGESLPFGTLRRFILRCDAELYNFYGPTESSVDSTFWRCALEGDQATVPIGRPIGNIEAYALDSRAQPVPTGVAGQLYIGGLGLARGYQERPDLTADMFVPNPFSREPGARLYKSGDLVRRRRDGNLEHLGRVDQQVKIRGFRIELEEIQSVLKQHPAVREAVVMAVEQEASTHLTESGELEYAQVNWPDGLFTERLSADHKNLQQLIDEIDSLSEEEVDLALQAAVF